MDESEHLSPTHRPDDPPGAVPEAVPEAALDSELDSELDSPLEPEVDARVRALLAAAADTAGSAAMPSDVSDRIAAALADEARLRVRRGPLSAADGGAVADLTGPTGPSVSTLGARRRQRPWVAVAAVAAAAAVVAAGVSALHVTKRPSPAAVVAADTPTTSATTSATTGAGATGSTPAFSPHIQLSRTDYRSGTFAAQARELLDHPATPLHDLAAESPSLGPVATPVGLASCLDAIGAGRDGAVSLDLATFEGRPAAIIVVTRDGTSTAYAVGRACSPGNVTALADATTVP